VFAPGTVKLPAILPANVPKKYPAVVMFPVALTAPPVNKLPPVILPVTTSLLLTIKLAPYTLPEALITPVTYSPVGDQTTTLLTPLTDAVILEFALAMFKLLEPFITLLTDVMMPVN